MIYLFVAYVLKAPVSVPVFLLEPNRCERPHGYHNPAYPSASNSLISFLKSTAAPHVWPMSVHFAVLAVQSLLLAADTESTLCPAKKRLSKGKLLVVKCALWLMTFGKFSADRTQAESTLVPLRTSGQAADPCVGRPGA